MKYVAGVLVGLTLLLAAGGLASAQPPASYTGINYGSSTLKLSPLDKDIWVATVERMGVRVDDSGKGPFHLVSTDLLMIMYADKTGFHYHGYETHADKDGDKVLRKSGTPLQAPRRARQRYLPEPASSKGSREPWTSFCSRRRKGSRTERHEQSARRS